jgi:uncharacterized membrane protein YphA (DoxX/SURF4 family)
MSSFVLLLVIVSMKGIGVTQEGVFDTMNECFDAREQLVEQLGRPIVNYQAVCVHWVDDPEKLKRD